MRKGAGPCRSRPLIRGACDRLDARLLLFERGVDFEFDFVADHRNAHRDAEIAALDRGFGFEAHGFLLGHAHARAVEIDVEGDGLGHAVQRQVPDERQVRRRLGERRGGHLDRLGDGERRGRELVGLQTLVA